MKYKPRVTHRFGALRMASEPDKAAPRVPCGPCGKRNIPIEPLHKITIDPEMAKRALKTSGPHRVVLARVLDIAKQIESGGWDPEKSKHTPVKFKDGSLATGHHLLIAIAISDAPVETYARGVPG